GIVLRSYELLGQNPDLAKLLVHRYPWLLVDEYQDLGAILHQLTVQLVGVGAHIVAVADPDQSIYSFAGADPQLAQDLHRESGFERYDLEFNYRSGSKI